MIVLALTGNIASGKSEVAKRFAALGATIIDADQLAREAVEPGTHALEQITRRFGRQILHPDGSLNRAALREVVFADERARRDLESIVHPEVERLRRQRITESRARGTRVVLCDIPLLFETGLDALFETIIFVDAPEALRRTRLLERRGLSPAQADAMIHAQEPSEAKRRRAAFVIPNEGTLAELHRRVDDVWNTLTRDGLS